MFVWMLCKLCYVRDYVCYVGTEVMTGYVMYVCYVCVFVMYVCFLMYVMYVYCVLTHEYYVCYVRLCSACVVNVWYVCM